ncbi:MAG: HAMP domain-containing sensor histidine kinase [Polyangiaceae bacterium]
MGSEQVTDASSSATSSTSAPFAQSPTAEESVPPPSRPSMPELGATPLLEDILPADSVRELGASFQRLTGMKVWVRSTSGRDLLGAADYEALLGLEIESGHVSEWSPATPSDDVFLGCPIEYDHDVVGRLVVGPFRRPGAAAGGSSPTFTKEVATAHLEHLVLSLDLILHARQRANYAASMHLASIEESYSELLRKNEALEEAYERLKELDRLKSSFLATISHELRTPLTSIIGYSEMLAEGMCGPLTKEQLEFVQTIRQKGDQLLKLILSLLDLSKLESGTLRMHPITLPVEAVLRDALSTIGPAASKKGVRLTLDPVPALPHLRADPDRLRQVFVNLVDNAVKFTPSGGEVALAARLAEAPADDGPGMVLLAPVRREIEIRVRDTGIGVPQHERGRIFDPFYQVDQSSTREQGGAGLGLAIVKRLVEAHQGRIRVEENRPQGAVFVVTLPLSAGSSGARPRVDLAP